MFRRAALCRPSTFLRSTQVVVNIKQSIHLLCGYCDAFASIVMLKSHLTLFSKRACMFFFSPAGNSFETLNILLCLIQSLSLCPSVQKENDGNVRGSVSQASSNEDISWINGCLTEKDLRNSGNKRYGLQCSSESKKKKSSIIDQQLVFYTGRYSSVTFPAWSNKVPRMLTETKKRTHRCKLLQMQQNIFLRPQSSHPLPTFVCFLFFFSQTSTKNDYGKVRAKS